MNKRAFYSPEMEKNNNGSSREERRRRARIVLIIIVVVIIVIMGIISSINKPIHLDHRSGDVIIVGGGTAGCILARRLSLKYPHKKIVVLDRGVNRSMDPIVYNIKNMLTAGFSQPYSEVLATDFPGVTASVSKMFGGGSSHNFALVVRGSPDYYNKSWKEQLGIDYNGLLTYFERIEAYHPEFSSNAPISPLRFTNGLIQMTPLPVSLNLAPRIRPLFWRGVQDPSILGKALRVITDAGPLRASDTFSNNVIAVINNATTVPIVDDYNTDVVTCITTTPQLFVDSVVGVRQSTDVKYLDKRMIRIDSASRGRSYGSHGNLQIVPSARVTNVAEEVVTWTNENGVEHRTILNDGGAIIMCAGGIYTPYLLLKSGYNTPHLGSNLKAHYGFNVVVAVERDNEELFSFSAGPMAFLPRYNGTNTRDWQFIVEGGGSPTLVLVGGVPNQTANTVLFSLIVWNLKPRTNGSILYDPLTTVPTINLHLFEDGDTTDPDSDISSMVDALRWINTSFIPGLKQSYNSMRVVFPPQAVLDRNVATELEINIKQGISLTDHYCKTAALGDVVDPNDFKMFGSNIRIVDASVFPEISDGNTNYPVMVMAEIASERIVL
jgi:choline dehydrogenase-like flavoprotein